jgi:hypothetical protein
MHDPVFGSLANRTVACKLDIFAVHLADKILESILTLAAVPMVVSGVEHVCEWLKSL